jgi:hypothetical protein
MDPLSLARSQAYPEAQGTFVTGLHWIPVPASFAATTDTQLPPDGKLVGTAHSGTLPASPVPVPVPVPLPGPVPELAGPVLTVEPMLLVLDVPGPVPNVDPEEVPGPLPGELAHAPVMVSAARTLAQFALIPAVTIASHPEASAGVIAAQHTARLAHEVPPLPGPVPAPHTPRAV